MLEQKFVEFDEVVVLDGAHLLLHEFMASYCALPENDQRPGENIRTLDRYGNRRCDINPRQEIAWTPAYGGAGHDIHAVGNAGTHAFGQIGFADGRYDARFLARVDCTAGENTCGIHKKIGRAHV